jgi:hypothetical protein
MPMGGGGRRGGSGGGRMAAGGSMARSMARMMAAGMAMSSMRRRRRRRRRMLLVGGLIALGAYKLSKRNVERVEEHTGQKAEDLTDEQLEQAMDQLGIEKEPMSDDEWAEVEKADAQPDYLFELERLAELHKQGVLTDEEFAAKKAQVLGL